MPHDWTLLIGKQVTYTKAYKHLLIKSGVTDPCILNRSGLCTAKLDTVCAWRKMAIMQVVWTRLTNESATQQLALLPSVTTEAVPSWWLCVMKRPRM